MNIKDLAEKVLKIAETNKEGFTLNINTLTLIDTGYAVAYKDTQDSFSEMELQYAVNHALSHDGILVGWYNSRNGKYYFDSCKVFSNVRDAINFGFKNNQLSIYDIATNRTIWLNK